MTLDADTCYAALTARDRRFDGLFFVGVKTTGIYCRPVCTARTPGRDRCTFYGTPAEAEKAGFRACLRCRPELAPGNSAVDALPRLVESAVALIGEGFMNDQGVDELASELGVTARHLRRAMEERLGVSPVELAQSRRLALAKQLLHDTSLGLAEIAFASGFQSVRRFNTLFTERFGRAPSALRREAGSAAGRSNQASGEAQRMLSLRLDYRPPFDWDALLGFLGPRAIPGVEHVEGGVYRRVVHVGGKTGIVAVRRLRDRPALLAGIPLALSGVLMPVVARLRALFDLDAQPDPIAEALSADDILGPLVRQRPGLRLPGAVDPFEMAARAVLGQQVSVRAATTLAGRLASRFGYPLPSSAEDRRLTHRFPTAGELASQSASDVAAIGLPLRRAESLVAIATAFSSGPLSGAARTRGPASIVAHLADLPGIGDWTAQYVAMRAFRHPDSFPAGDLGLRKALGGLSAKQAAARAERWSPWRSYAVLHLWTALSN